MEGGKQLGRRGGKGVVGIVGVRSTDCLAWESISRVADQV